VWGEGKKEKLREIRTTSRSSEVDEGMARGKRISYPEGILHSREASGGGGGKPSPGFRIFEFSEVGLRGRGGPPIG